MEQFLEYYFVFLFSLFFKDLFICLREREGMHEWGEGQRERLSSRLPAERGAQGGAGSHNP